MTGLSSAATAALGSQAPVAAPERLAWVDVESPPTMVAILDPADGKPLGHYAQFADDLGLTDLMADRARALSDHVDDGDCEANPCVSSPYVRDGVAVGAPIGWVLAGEADERTEWRPMTLIQRGRKVIAVCLDCSPSSIYDRTED